VAGCSWDQLNPFKPPTPPPPPVESFILRTGGLEPEKAPEAKSVQAKLAGARELYRQKDYANAERLYHHLGHNEKNPVPVIQESLYYEAECLRQQGRYPKAGDVYADLLKKFVTNPYRDQAIQHMFDISMFWLQDTWEEMHEAKEQKDGDRWIVWPRFVTWDKQKPLVDREGRAIQLLEDVQAFDSKGPLADKALLVCGYVKLYHEDYREADHCFTRIHEDYPNSQYAPHAVELAIFSKMMSTGGPDYDGRKVAEARKLVDDALRARQIDDAKKQQYMELLGDINAQQAEKEFRMAEFWRRTGHPGSAYFYYELVRRRYPNTDAATLATQRMQQIYAKLQREQGDLGPPPQPLPRQPELLPQPRKLIAQPENIPPPQTVPGPGPGQGPVPGTTPPDQPEAAPPPRVLPQGLGGR
jgi:outer membrane protein assembly factor BamD (BamD/ComL family)